MGFLMIIVAVFALKEYNTLLTILLAVFTAIYQYTLGTYLWVYVGLVTTDEGLSIGTFTIWFGVVILSLTTNTMFDKMNSYGVFFFFAACSFASAVAFHFTLKETKGKTREQCQRLYAKAGSYPNDPLSSAESKGLLDGNKVSIGGTTGQSDSMLD